MKIIRKVFKTDFGNFLMKTKLFRISLIPTSLLFLWFFCVGLIMIIGSFHENFENPYTEQWEYFGLGVAFLFIAPLVSAIFSAFVSVVIWALNPNWKDKQYL